MDVFPPSCAYECLAMILKRASFSFGSRAASNELFNNIFNLVKKIKV